MLEYKKENGDNMKKIILVDGNSLMFRAYYATAYAGVLMKNSKGLYTNAIYGFANMINSLVEQEHDNMFIAFDKGSKTFRHQSFADYKATRKKLPEELAMQIPLIKQFLRILKITQYETDEYEADDLIATLAKDAYNHFDQIQVITGDKDLLQLVNDKTIVSLTKKGIQELDDYTIDNFFEKMGIKPSQIPDYKGLVGDSSDNLPGIKGIGDKTAIKLLTTYPTLEEIIENVDSITGRTAALIKEYQEMGLQCKRLATLQQDVTVEFHLTDTKKEEYDLDELKQFYMDMDFNSFLTKLDKKKQAKKEQKQIEYKFVTEAKDIQDMISKDSIVILETFGKNYYNTDFLGLAIVNDVGNFFVPKEVILQSKELISFLEDYQFHKKTYDAKKLQVALESHGIKVAGINFDLMLAAYIINPTFGDEDIKKATQHLYESSIPFEENIYGANTKAKIPSSEIYSHYAVEKALLVKETYDIFYSELEKMNGTKLLFDLEIPLASVLGKMETVGLKVDETALEDIGIDLSGQLTTVESIIFELAGEEFNVNSVKQLGNILFEKLKLPHGKKNKTGYSTNVDVLENLASDYEIAKRILEYRTLNKLITTYVNGLKEVITEGYIHPLYKQALTVTGRLSSTEPNIQNMPIRTEIGQVIRKVFVSRFADGQIMAADYSQIELRILAHLANEHEMIDAFRKGVDFHTQTAGTLYDVPLEEVTSSMRRVAKAINFGIIYGMSAWGLSENLKISALEANIFINKYFDRYKNVKKYLDEIVEKAKQDGYTKTIFNRRRYIPELANKNINIREFGKRTAMNAPIQGSAADIIKKAMIEVDTKMREYHMESIMIAQVHDELIFDVKPHEKEKLKEIVVNAMESAVHLSVPLSVDVGFGKDWFEAK